MAGSSAELTCSWKITGRNRAETVLRESETRLARWPIMPPLIWINSPAGCEFVNRATSTSSASRWPMCREWAGRSMLPDDYGAVSGYLAAAKSALFEARWFRRADGVLPDRTVGLPHFSPAATSSDISAVRYYRYQDVERAGRDEYADRLAGHRRSSGYCHRQCPPLRSSEKEVAERGGGSGGRSYSAQSRGAIAERTTELVHGIGERESSKCSSCRLRWRRGVLATASRTTSTTSSTSSGIRRC